MDAGQLFEQLQKRSNQNPNDIAVVLDAMITTIIHRIEDKKSIEFADFGHFSQSEYGKIDFEVSPEFAKIVNYRYNDMEAVPLSDVDESIFPAEPPSEIFDEPIVTNEIEEVAETSVSEDETETRNEDAIFIEDADSDNQLSSEIEKSAESSNDMLGDKGIFEADAAGESSSVQETEVNHEEKPEISVSSYVTEILDEIQSKPTPEFKKESEIPKVEIAPEEKPVIPEAKPVVKKLDTVIEDSSLIVNVKEKETMQSHQSLGNSSPKSAEYDNNYGAGGLSNAELGGESDTKKWIIIISLIVVAIAVAIWIAFHADKKDEKQATTPVVQTDSVQTETAVPVPVKEDPKAKPTDKKATDSKTKPAKDAAKTPAKDTKTAAKTAKPATPTTDASGKITVNYSALSDVSGIKEANGAYTISVSSWSKKPAAEKEQQKWENAGVTASVKEIYLVDKGGYWYRVQIGRYASRKAALAAVEDVKAEVPDAYVDTVE